MTDETELKPTPGTLDRRGNDLIAFPGLNDGHIIARFVGPDAEANLQLVMRLWNFRTEPDKRITDLEAQLAECQRERDTLRDGIRDIINVESGFTALVRMKKMYRIAKEALAATKEVSGE